MFLPFGCRVQLQTAGYDLYSVLVPMLCHVNKGTVRVLPSPSVIDLQDVLGLVQRDGHKAIETEITKVVSLFPRKPLLLSLIHI